MDTTRRMAFEMNCLLTINAYHGLYDPPIDLSPGPNPPFLCVTCLCATLYVCLSLFFGTGTKGDYYIIVMLLLL